MPTYLDEPSEEETKFFESQQGETGDDPAKKADAPETPALEETKKPAEQAAQEEPEGKADKTVEEPKVNLGALHEARARGRETQAQLEEARRSMANMESRFQEVLRKMEETRTAEPEPAPVPGPSYEEDPEGYYRHQIETMNSKLAGLETKTKQTTEQGEAERKQAEDQQRFLSRYRASAHEYGEKQKDFMDAYSWLAQDIDAELQVRGISDPLQRQQVMAQEERRMVELAFDASANPAERLYELAKRRGYKATVAEGASEAEKIVNIGKAQAQAKSLSGTGGAPGAEPSLENLATLNGPEFDAAWEKLRRAGKLG